MKARNSILFVEIFIFSFLQGAGSNFRIYSDDLSPSAEKVGYIFAHGLGATQEQASLFLPNTNSNKWLINKPLVVFDFPDAKNNAMEYHSSHVNLGQEVDISRLRDTFDRAKAELLDHRFVFAGISRGSATVINYVASYQPDGVAALVLESPFDTLSNVIKHLLKRFHISWLPFSKQIALRLAKNSFPLLDIQGLFPLNVIHRIQSHIPIIIIHSCRDRTISVNSSRNLYKSLVLAGHPHVYFLELASGDHGKLVYSIESDLYAAVLHAFYKKYGLPHVTHLAHNGENMLKYCQPNLEEINRKIKRSKNSEDFDDEEDAFNSLFINNASFELEILPFATKMHTIF